VSKNIIQINILHLVFKKATLPTTTTTTTTAVFFKKVAFSVIQKRAACARTPATLSHTI
jgi:hypothetical protein